MKAVDCGFQGREAVVGKLSLNQLVSIQFIYIVSSDNIHHLRAL